MSDGDTTSSELERSLVALGLAVLSFLGGALTTEFETFPYPQLLERPFLAFDSYMERLQTGSPPYTDFWFPLRPQERFQTKGVTRHVESKAYDGYTLYTSGHAPASYLIDMQGRVVHEWRKPFREVWADPPHVDDPVAPSMIHWGGSHLFDNGDLLVNYTADGTTPYGYGLVRLNADSTVQWRYGAHVHHDYDLREDGTIVALVHDMRDLEARPVSGTPKRARFVLEDELVVLSKEGEEIERFSLLEAIGRSDRFRPILAQWFGARKPWDTLHANNVDVLGEDFAEHHDFAEPGDVLLSFRSLHALALVDLDDERITWARRGFWVRQHDPDPLPNGHLLLYDNQGHTGPGGLSQVVEFDPGTGEIVWRYAGSEEAPFQTLYRGKQTPLPNGNVLIVESNAGRLLEVTREGEIAWEFVNPERMEAGGRTFVAALTGGAERIPPERLDFQFAGGEAED